MGEPITVHDPMRWVMVFATLSIQGFGDGDIITIEPATETVLAKRGVRGEVALALKTDNVASVKIALHQTSRTNALLRAYFRAQFIPGALVPKICSLRNAITGEAWRGLAWLVSDAPLKIGAEVQNIEWEFGLQVSSYTPANPALA